MRDVINILVHFAERFTGKLKRDSEIKEDDRSEKMIPEEKYKKILEKFDEVGRFILVFRISNVEDLPDFLKKNLYHFNFYRVSDKLIKLSYKMKHETTPDINILEGDIVWILANYFIYFHDGSEIIILKSKS